MTLSGTVSITLNNNNTVCRRGRGQRRSIDPRVKCPGKHLRRHRGVRRRSGAEQHQRNPTTFRHSSDRLWNDSAFTRWKRAGGQRGLACWIASRQNTYTAAITLTLRNGHSVSTASRDGLMFGGIDTTASNSA